MQITGLVTLDPGDTASLDALADMMGQSFMEEYWTETWLASLDELGTSDERKLEISRAIMRGDLAAAAPFGGCHMLSEYAAGTLAYLSSDLQGKVWQDLEDAASENLLNAVLTPNEAAVMEKRAAEMASISNFSWAVEHAAGEDFIHFVTIGVNPAMRRSGSFRRLVTPLLDYADAHGINCYLECYRDHLEGLYGHFGFETVHRFSNPAFDAVERAMVRKPR